MALQCSRIFAQRQLSGCLFREFTRPQLRFVGARTAGSAAPLPGEDFDAKKCKIGKASISSSYHLQTTVNIHVINHTQRNRNGNGFDCNGLGSRWPVHEWTVSSHNLLFTRSSSTFIVPVFGKLGLAFPLCYHYLNGIRHLV
ncbi:hypothetical protein L9F63_012115, partial [Diploptera punctata]